MNIVLICVNYQNDAETATFVRSIRTLDDGADVRITIVDNSGPIPENLILDSLVRDDCNAILVRPGKNLGYFGAASFGLQSSVAAWGLQDWIIVSNTDIEMPQKDIFKRIDASSSAESVGVVAPMIKSIRTGRDQNPAMKQRPSKIRMWLYKHLYALPWGLRLYEGASRMKQALSRALRQNINAAIVQSEIYAPHGAFIIFHKKYFDLGGTLNHGVLMFGEEISVAEAARRCGLKILHDPTLHVTHREHSTTAVSARRLQMHAEAAAYCADTYFSCGSARR